MQWLVSILSQDAEVTNERTWSVDSSNTWFPQVRPEREGERNSFGQSKQKKQKSWEREQRWGERRLSHCGVWNVELGWKMTVVCDGFGQCLPKRLISSG